jgi:hypothetical protein
MEQHNQPDAPLRLQTPWLQKSISGLVQNHQLGGDSLQGRLLEPVLTLDPLALAEKLVPDQKLRHLQKMAGH